MKRYYQHPIIKIAATPLLLLYKLVNLIRRFLYEKGVLRSYDVSIPVVSVGNIVMGGSGKTPFVMWLAEKLIEAKKKPVILIRGYGRKNERKDIVIIPPAKDRKSDPDKVGDEPAMMARALPAVPIVCAADRVRGAGIAIQEFRPDIIILDDGFQHHRLKRKIDIVLIPPRPTCWKREFNSAYNKADILIQTGDCKPKNIKHKIPIYKADRRIGDLLPLKKGKKIKVEALKGKRVAVVAGVAEPEAFFEMICATGALLVKRFPFPDHYTYSKKDIQNIERNSKDSSCQLILTTAKDEVKLLSINCKYSGWFVVPLNILIDKYLTLIETIRIHSSI